MWVQDAEDTSDYIYVALWHSNPQEEEKEHGVCVCRDGFSLVRVMIEDLKST